MMQTADGQAELPLNGLSADYGWFHVMKPRIMAGLIKDIGETAWATYTVIKAHADHSTGRSYPSQTRIGDLIGKTPETVSRSVKVLTDANLLSVGKQGRNAIYTLLESSPLKDRLSGAPQGSADFPYVPKEFASQLQALKAFISEGVPPGSGLTLNLTVNLVQQRDNGTVNIQTVQMTPDGIRPDLRELAKKMRML